MEYKITMRPILGKGNSDGNWYNTLTLDVIDSDNVEHSETWRKGLKYPLFMPATATDAEKAAASAYQKDMIVEDFEVKCCIRCMCVEHYGIFTSVLKSKGYSITATKPIHRNPSPLRYIDVEEIEEYHGGDSIYDAIH